MFPTRRVALCLAVAVVLSPWLAAQQPETSGAFVLHRFARAIGKETYSIQASGDTYTLTSHFLFTDRNSPVPLETTFSARADGMVPISYSAKGRSAREIEMQDTIEWKDGTLNLNISGKTRGASPAGRWFITDGYSPVSMQEQMMRWWVAHNRPSEFTVYPAEAKVHIEPAAEMKVSGRVVHGYTIAGLIWGQECLWIDDGQNLVALVSTDAEFDHFEAVREAYESSLNDFIASAVQSNLAALAKLSASGRVAPSRRLAIVGATLEDSTGAAAVPDSVIVIEDGVIKAAGARAQVRIPKGATILDAKGKYAVPGLWDMHAHYEQVEWGPIYLAAGVTTVRDCGNEFDFIRTLHEELDRKQNPAIGPHLEFAGVIDGEGVFTLGAILATTPEQGIAWVDKYKAIGARQIKIYSSIKPDVLQAITAEAHKQGLTVTGHIPEGMNAIEGINDGMDQINHIMYETPYFTHPVLGADGKPDRSKPPVLELDGPRAKELTEALIAHHTVLDPTMVVFETFFHSKPMSELEPGITHVAPQLREALDNPAPPSDQIANAEARWQALMATLRELHKAGVPTVAGTDQSIPGYSLHREMEIYVEAGFTPLEALQAATIASARAMGVEKESGSLEQGKRGDVLLLDADPLADIHNTRKIWRTVAAGAVYDPVPLWRSVDFVP